MPPTNATSAPAQYFANTTVTVGHNLIHPLPDAGLPVPVLGPIPENGVFQYTPPTQLQRQVYEQPPAVLPNQNLILTTQEDIIAYCQSAYNEGSISGFKKGYIMGHDACLEVLRRRNAYGLDAGGAGTIQSQSPAPTSGT